MSDYPQRAIDNVSAGPVIHIQKNLSGIRIIICKLHHNAWLCPPEPIDGLVIIPYDKQIVFRRRKHADHVILGLVHILEFIHQYIAELLLPLFEDIPPF